MYGFKLAPLCFGKAGVFFSLKTLMISSIQAEPLYQSEFFLRQKYLSEGLSANQIAIQIFSARSTVINALRGFNIPLRSEDEQRRLTPGQLRFGERIVKGKVVAHKGELALILEMKRMRDSGLSYGDIARELQKSGQESKNGKRWHPTTVLKILKSKQ